MSAKPKTDDTVVIVRETTTTNVVREYIKVSKDLYADTETTCDALLQHGTKIVNKKPQTSVRMYAYEPVNSWNKLSSTHQLLTKNMVVEKTGEAAGKHYRSLKTIKH